MRLTDEQLKAAMISAMRSTIDRMPDGHLKDQMQRECERWESGDQERIMAETSPDAITMFYGLLRDFIQAANNPPRTRRRNLPQEQADAIAERVAARKAKMARKRS